MNPLDPRELIERLGKPPLIVAWPPPRDKDLDRALCDVKPEQGSLLIVPGPPCRHPSKVMHVLDERDRVNLRLAADVARVDLAHCLAPGLLYDLSSSPAVRAIAHKARTLDRAR